MNFIIFLVGFIGYILGGVTGAIIAALCFANKNAEIRVNKKVT